MTRFFTDSDSFGMSFGDLLCMVQPSVPQLGRPRNPPHPQSRNPKDDSKYCKSPAEYT